jgi:polyhydroxybutyrate depolymerase
MSGGDDQPATPDAAGSGDSGSAMPDAPAQSASCDNKAAQPLDANWTVTVGSVNRMARVHVPASYDPAKRTPLVINAHGRTSNGSQQAWLSHMIQKSDAEGFIVIHPESNTSPTSWNSGGGCCDPAYSANVDDIGFIRKVLDDAEAKLCVDTSRVFVTGLSNGGYLAHSVACAMADRVAAIGAVAGLLQLQTCGATKPMPVFLVHGTADTLVSYDWVPATVNYWKAKNGCTTQATTYTNGVASCVTHGGCTAGADVVLCTIQGGGHQWPGGEAVPFLGTKSDDINATNVQWSFFVAHPRTSL